MAFALSLPSLPKKYQPAAIWALYIIGLSPGVWYFYLAATGGLGFNPVKEFEHLLGTWALRFLCLGLVVTPLRDLFNVNLIAYRRALGLIAFYYVLAHLAVYLVLDRGMVLSSILGDILKRPYIMFGMAGLVMLIPLAVTSNRWSIRKLGSRWNMLHKLAYPILIVAVLHFFLARKSLTLEPAFYISVTVILLGYRLIRPAIMARKRANRATKTVRAVSRQSPQ
ncbi:protein-methionine-sulfoxide reductase heme-binding subunit MsrQ [Agrobacterium rosae]|uniref:Protein-methionine-sulfoxide reductase heme-binding subunit MsrQ n=1 Tax=Agrobacterium rosae TaxID=1972867 RepID=A0AAE5RW17_9HYPH|nr:protein-methionine-sulfoxide reductase heme-binding subunit MsrQ [Agrobacterium rosae]KAA3510151.1 protein-methionine-sulfoxide reductase heme-binding subunit MsrQ [Agrobacterium rosae]KAA3514905.1 protein-methionine-sulfoxide reductase heme-binding subunit MsrQ [Agrobacterium rosae]MCM2433357.1 protein-methionine-sulfoxide reductase heme-binding subunit MsrQ [Agrobacterium rosae]MDX8332007.1 protein-methionine-sulfoxide reductase heme-binding subunit MsrQ [Agrobacterium rosae]MQB50773.1 pr